MKKIVALFMLLVLAYNMAGFLVIYKILQFKLREKIQADLKWHQSYGTLSVFSSNQGIKSTDFELLGHDEISHNGRMYDIVKIEKKDGKTIFYCLSDEQETSLLQKMSGDIIKNTSPDHRGSRSQFLKVLLGFYMLPDNGQAVKIPALSQKPASATETTQKPPYLFLHFPPPKTV
ncbi:MAG TPA: hypothetical protein VG603_10395 [Chitinophagales bacterium]|nr:hypothetical protein [Chitinophagales bacterium]